MIDIDNWNKVINDSAIRGYEEELKKKDILLREKNKEIERLHSIIKEVREKIEGVQILGLRSGKILIATLLNDILAILDKVGDDKE